MNITKKLKFPSRNTVRRILPKARVSRAILTTWVTIEVIEMVSMNVAMNLRFLQRGKDLPEVSMAAPHGDPRAFPRSCKRILSFSTGVYQPGIPPRVSSLVANGT